MRPVSLVAPELLFSSLFANGRALIAHRSSNQQTRPLGWRVTILVALLLTGCSVAVPDPTPDAISTPVCAAVMADLPATVLDQSRRKVKPGMLSAAWGKPTIVLRCGVPKPVALTNASECIEVNGVGWFRETANNGDLFTTIGRPVFVELAVPTAYAPETNALVDVATTVSAHDPVTTPCQ